MTASGFALLDDVLGDGFALLAPPGTPPQTLSKRGRLEEANAARDPPCRGTGQGGRVGGRSSDCRRARPARRSRAALTGYPAGLYLLRPDRYVAAFFPVQNLQLAGDAIAKLTRETWPAGPNQDSTARLDAH